MIMSDDSWYVVRNTPGVTGFVGSGNRPIPLSPDEVNMILGDALKAKEPEIRVDFDLGQLVTITGGAFKDHQGIIKELQPEKGKAIVSVEHVWPRDSRRSWTSQPSLRCKCPLRNVEDIYASIIAGAATTAPPLSVGGCGRSQWEGSKSARRTTPR